MHGDTMFVSLGGAQTGWLEANKAYVMAFAIKSL